MWSKLHKRGCQRNYRGAAPDDGRRGDEDGGRRPARARGGGPQVEPARPHTGRAAGQGAAEARARREAAEAPAIAGLELSEEELARRAKRAGRFAADAARPPPPPPKRTFAHPGGKITSNKEEATMNFLKRKAEAEQEPPAQRPQAMTKGRRRASELTRPAGDGISVLASAPRRRSRGVPAASA